MTTRLREDYMAIRRTHTPGPWSVLERPSDDLQGGTDLYVGLPDRRDEKGDYSLAWAEEHVALIYGAADREANARLIAAAPELLAALRSLVESLTWEKNRSGTTYAGYETARDAIRKATEAR
jgi:hypothetical protein